MIRFYVKVPCNHYHNNNDNNNNYYYYYTPYEFFTPVWADSLLLVFGWQQVSSGLQDSSQYSRRPQKCYGQDSPNSFSDF